MRFRRDFHAVGFAVGFMVALMVALSFFAGCRRDEPAAGPKLPEIGKQDLSELGEYMPPLDGQRLEVAPPKGWTVSPRAEGYLVRFRESTAEKYPMILLTAEDCEAAADLSQDNVQEFADRTRQQESLGTVEPIRIDDFIGIVYRKRGKEAKSVNRILERLLLITVANGRKYTVELRTREGSLEEGKGALFAVAGGIRFAGSRVTEEESAPTKKSPEKKPPKKKLPEKKRPKKKPADEPDPDLKGLEDLFKES